MNNILIVNVRYITKIKVVCKLCVSVNYPEHGRVTSLLGRLLVRFKYAINVLDPMYI